MYNIHALLSVQIISLPLYAYNKHIAHVPRIGSHLFLDDCFFLNGSRVPVESNIQMTSTVHVAMKFLCRKQV